MYCNIFTLFSPFIESPKMQLSTTSATATTSTTSKSPNWPTHTQCEIRESYGRPLWALTSTIPIQSAISTQKCFVTCLNTEEGRLINDGIWRPYLPNTPITRVTINNDVIDDSQFITAYEQFLYSKLKRLQNEMQKMDEENTKLKVELTDLYDRLASGRFSLTLS